MHSRPAGKLQGVDALRGVAAILVVTLHATHTISGPRDFGVEPFGGLFGFGRAGVDFFFVLSGFVIAYIHFGDVGDRSVFPSFWAKRLLRIYPTYWITTVLLLGLYAVSPTPTLEERDLGHVIASFLLWPEAAPPVLGVGWSLRHELVFYALFSVLLLNRRAGIAVLGGWFCALVYGLVVHAETGVPAFEGPIGMIVLRDFNIQFFFGIAAAWALRSRLVWRPAALAVLGAAVFLGTGLWESFFAQPMQEWPVRTLAYAVGASLCLYGVATLDAAGRTRTPRLALRFGAASYSIYLTHLPVVLILEFALRPVAHAVHMPVELGFLLVVGGTVWLGTWFSEWVEQPLLRAGRRWSAGGQAVSRS